MFGSRTEGIYFQKGSLTKEKVFFLSGREASDYLGNYHNAPQLIACDTDGAAAIWWFRSPYVEDPDSTYAGVSRVDGRVNVEPVTSRQAARPAFNLDAASVLFRSPAENGKNASRSGLEAVGEYTGNEWKLTVIDTARSTFAAATTEVEGNVLTFSYQNAKTGANEYLSAITKDAGGNVICYGRICSLTARKMARTARQSSLYRMASTKKRTHCAYSTSSATAIKRPTMQARCRIWS